MTNEEILDASYRHEPYMSDPNSYPKRVALSAMDAAREEDAIGFAEWILKNAYTNYDMGYWHLHEAASGLAYTTEQLYQLYKKQTP